ncbi:hypothetical protein HY638_00290 [Candidatus Woesearchaeota archaeon]|nr:hypothetical protein [Candidatus Woesearchaeota archaeon]
MKHKKAIALLCFAFLILLSLSAGSEEIPINCCTNVNPNVPEESICSEGITQETCCSADTVGGAIGAQSLESCTSDYFKAAGCEAFSAGQCDTACCCKDGQALDIDKIPRILCTEKKSGFYTEPADPSQTCTQVCRGTPTDCGDGNCEIPEEDSISCPQDCPLNTECTNPLYTPRLSNLQIVPEQGKDKMRVTWNDECSNTLVRYTVTRCTEPGCTDSVSFPPITENKLVDANQLLFDVQYTYKIKGEYDTGKTSEISGAGTLGDFECLTQAAENKKFCIQPSYYDQLEIAEYLARAGISPNETTYNSGFQCQAGNKLTLVRKCDEGNACAVFNGNVDCVVGGSACNFPEGNPFGMYYSRGECEGSANDYKYCFLDRSTTLVDNCYQCASSMVCYDYKSSGACMSDNCKVSGCQWVEVQGLQALGIGVCVDTSKDNCQYCSKPGSDGASNINSFNTIYDICSEAKLNALTNGQGCGCTTAGQTKACPDDHPTLGKCKKGIQTCRSDLTWGACTGVVYPDDSETCANGIDDDCDGSIDSGCAESLCDGNDNNNNGLYDEGFADWDRDNNAQCDYVHDRNQIFCGADCIDLDRDGDNVHNNLDRQNLTEIGCLVYNESRGDLSSLWGIGIDQDGDKRCLGVDCSDIDKNIQVNCTIAQICSNKFQDAGEEEVDCGGQCLPCKVSSMSMESPKFSVSSSFTFALEFTSSRAGVCRYFLDNQYSSYPNMKPFEVSGGKTHKIANFRDITDEQEHKIYVKCTDEYWKNDADLNRFAFNLSVDTSAPRFHPEDPQADPNPVIQILPGKNAPQTNLLVYTDDKTICKYGEVNSWAALNGKFEGYNNNTFKTFHQKTLSLPSAQQATYKYYIGCKNPAEPELISSIFERVISVDLLQKIALIDYTRKYYSGPPNDPVVLNISANKLTDNCFWGETSGQIFQQYPSAGSSRGEYFYSKSIASRLNGTPFIEGNYNYYSVCMEGGDTSAILSHSIIIDKTPPSKPVVNDSSKYVNNSEFTWLTSELQLRLFSEDNSSGINYYVYWLEDSRKKTILNFTNTTKHDEAFMVTGLNLTNGESYYFFAKAFDGANLASDIGKSDGIKVDVSRIPATCSDGIKNSDESSKDCGGSCTLCQLNETCKGNDDCISKSCDKSKVPFVCAAPSCQDNILNGNESDVDCGGSCTSKCGVNKKCSKDTDCISPNKCNAAAKLCTGIDSCSNSKLDPDETDVDCGGDICSPCSIDSTCSINSDCSSKYCDAETKKCGKPDCFDGIKNGDETGTDCGGLCSPCGSTIGLGDRDNDGISDDWEDKYCGGDCDPDEDMDNDGLINSEEHTQTTNPVEADTDGDGYSDGEEVDAGTDPLDPNSKPESSFFLTFMLVLGILALLFVAAYAFYTYYYLPKKRGGKPPASYSSQKTPMQGPQQQKPKTEEKFGGIEEHKIPPIQPLPLTAEQIKRRDEIKQLLEKRREQREASRKKVFEVFGIKEGQKQKVAEKPAAKVQQPEKPAVKAQKPSSAAKKPEAVKSPPKPAPKKKETAKAKPKESAMERLSRIAKRK